MTLLIAAVVFWGYLNIKTTEDDHKESVRKFDKILHKVNLEWDRELVDGCWRTGDDAAWIELEVVGKYDQPVSKNTSMADRQDAYKKERTFYKSPDRTPFDTQAKRTSDYKTQGKSLGYNNGDHNASRPYIEKPY